jgi:hypothetical protein
MLNLKKREVRAEKSQRLFSHPGPMGFDASKFFAVNARLMSFASQG